VEFLEKGGAAYSKLLPTNNTLQIGDRLRFKYASDADWRVLESYGTTQFTLFETHYEIGGEFFHSFRDGMSRIQVPSLEEARQRRDKPDSLPGFRRNLRFFVEVVSGAPKAPPPQGNCAVWQGRKLLMNDLMSGEVATALPQGGIDHLAIETHIPGIIFALGPPSEVSVYAVRIDFEKEIFTEIGRKKGESDSAIQQLSSLLQMANTPERQAWCQARIAYEQDESAFWSERDRMYALYLANQLDSVTLIQAGHPMPHVVMANVLYRHENLAIEAAMTSDHLGKCLIPANAFLWINNSVPVRGTPFALQFNDVSNPSFMGFDTRFRSEGNQLIAEERPKDQQAWSTRPEVVDIYRYAQFTPPVPGGPPMYLVDLTADLTGGLKRIGMETQVNARLGTIQLTPDSFRLEMQPQIFTSVGSMDNFVKQVLVDPFHIRDWARGRRSRIQDAFAQARLLPDELLDEVEQTIDELGLRMYEIENTRRGTQPSYRFQVARLSVEIARTVTPGEMYISVVLANEAGQTAVVNRNIRPRYDILDLAARSVAMNRGTSRLADFRPMTIKEWLDLRRPMTVENP
jgi:hypothetical protein